MVIPKQPLLGCMPPTSDNSLLCSLRSSFIGALATDSYFLLPPTPHASFKFYYCNKNALCWLFPRTLRAYVLLQNSPFLKHTPPLFAANVGGLFPDSESLENQSQQAISWICLVAKGKREMP